MNLFTTWQLNNMYQIISLSQLDDHLCKVYLFITISSQPNWIGYEDVEDDNNDNHYEME